MTVALSPFIEPVRAQASAAFEEAIRQLIEDPDAAVVPDRQVSPLTDGPTRIVVRRRDAALGIVVRKCEGPWTAGGLSFSVERETDGHMATANPISRNWLRNLGKFFSLPGEQRAERGRNLASLHHTWATVRYIDDRVYRHIEQAHIGPTAFMRVSFRCNQDCHFCWQGRDWPDPPDSLVHTWLEELAMSGASNITFCGGEPTLSALLPSLIDRAAHHHRMRVHMNTNAIRLRDREFATRLRDAGLASTLVSFHSADPTISDSMTRAPGTWRRTVEGIHGALEAGLKVIINCVVEQSNVAGLAQHAAFVRQHFVEAHLDNPVRMVNYSQAGRYYDEGISNEQMPPIDIARPQVVAASRILHEAGVLLEITGSCGFPSCIARDIPELVPWRHAGTMDPGHASARVHDPPPCQRCSARSYCIGPRREYVEKWGDRGLIPFDTLPTSDWYEWVAAAGLADEWALGDQKF